MKRLALLAVLALTGCSTALSTATTGIATPAASARCHVGGTDLFEVPDRRPGCTPGMWISDPAVKKTPASAEYDPDVSRGHVCSKAYNPRPGTSVSGPLKDEADRLYGEPTSINSKVEADHRYPRWLGGATNIQNFWPEPNDPQARGFDHNPKDKLEFAIYRLTCLDHRLTVAQARSIFEGNWTSAYQRYVK